MKNFEYFSPQNVKEAYTSLSQYPEEAKIIAGGQSLLILLKQRLISPSYLIDIKGISDLDYIRYDEKDGLRIGALTTHRTIEMSPVVREKFFILAEMERRLASIQIRNWGTLGGNLCHGDPASDLAPPLIALDAETKLTGPAGERVVKMEEFFKDYYETVLRFDEILAEIHVPVVPQGGGIYVKTSIRETDMALAGVATFIVMDPKNHKMCKDIRIVMGSVGPTPIRAIRGEEALRGQKIDDRLIEKAAQIASEDSEPISDIHASEEYKKEMVKVLVKQTVQEAMARATAASHR
jgi:CO/xanthine dehydrogenase FAD-binding subunit